MKVTDYITKKVDRLPRRHIFTCEDFTKEVKNKKAIIKAVNRMAVAGMLRILPQVRKRMIGFLSEG